MMDKVFRSTKSIRELIESLSAKILSGDMDAALRLCTIATQPMKAELLDTQFEFRAAPRQEDEVLQPIIQLLLQLRRKHIHMANTPIEVMPSTNSPPIWPLGLHPKEVIKYYTFDDGMDIPRTVGVSLTTPDQPLTAEMLQVELPRKGKVSLTEWLLSLPNSNLVGKEGIFAQQKWWKLNGKVFPFMRLPVELRMIIYEYTLGPNIYPRGLDGRATFGYPAPHRRAAIRFGLPESEPTIATKSMRALNVAILLACRQTYEEGFKAAWEGTLKSFYRTIVLESCLLAFHGGGGPISDADYNWLNRVQHDLDERDYFWIFRDTSADAAFKCSATYLKDMPNLRSLQINFRQLGVSGLLCQRMYVDWVMTLAYPYVHNIPKVHITGAVRKTSVDRWTYLKQGACDSDFDRAAELAVFRSITEEFWNVNKKVPCDCEVNCAWCFALERTKGIPLHLDDDTYESLIPKMEDENPYLAWFLGMAPGL